MSVMLIAEHWKHSERTLAGIQDTPGITFKILENHLNPKISMLSSFPLRITGMPPAALWLWKQVSMSISKNHAVIIPMKGEIIVKAASKYNRKVQMGNQRRSYPNIVSGIGTNSKQVWSAESISVKDGIRIIGHRLVPAKKLQLPEWLDWNLWQGPAPRKTFKDNIVHYNWHWFWHWGTGEALNNGTHMIDLLRWGMGVDFPMR